MAMQSDGKKAKGRSYDQATKGGSSSAATMGSGGTGDCGSRSGATAGNAQSGARTDDWLSSGSDQEREQGFRPSDPEAIKTGMEGIGSRSGAKTGNRQ